MYSHLKKESIPCMETVNKRTRFLFCIDIGKESIPCIRTSKEYVYTLYWVETVNKRINFYFIWNWKDIYLDLLFWDCKKNYTLYWDWKEIYLYCLLVCSHCSYRKFYILKRSADAETYHRPPLIRISYDWLNLGLVMWIKIKTYLIR